MSGRAGFSDDFHQRVLFNLFNSSLNEDHVLDTPASSQHLQVKRNATPSDDNDYLLKSRKRRSKVWNDFKLDIKSDGKKKAICDHCNKEFVGESKKGTSHLSNHLKVCPVKKRKKEDENKPSESGNLTAHVVGKKSTVDLELSSLDLTHSAIKGGWKTFMDDLLHVYEDEKQKLYYWPIKAEILPAMQTLLSCQGEEGIKVTEMMENKRSPCTVEQGSLTTLTSKRHKTDLSVSNKERKEKLGERIVAVQQLVSPYGKTDTASVLLEAMEYIPFLHEQVKVLSAPYLQSTSTSKMQDADGYSLRSRGLCLVPTSCTAGEQQ